MQSFDVGPVDLTILVVYLISSRIIPLIFSADQVGTDGYFLGGRSFLWPLVGLSLFATNMSGSSFVGLAGAGYNQGVSVYSYEWMAAIILIFFAIFLLPVYLNSKVFTVPEFLERRYDRRSRLAFSAFNVFTNVFIDCAAALYAGGLVIRALFPVIPLWMPVVGLALLAGVYAIFGGLWAVVVSDSIQACVLVLGAVTISVLTFRAVPSWKAVRDAAPPETLSIIRPASDPALPWPGLVTGVLIVGIYFWCTNQLMVQRTLGAKNLDHGRWGALFAGALKLPVLFTMILPGTMALALYPNLSNPDLVWPTLAFDLLPVGLRGVVLAALVAAITSSVDSVFNSASSIVTMDLVRTLRPGTSARALTGVGRLTTGIVMIVAAAWAPQIQNFPTLWIYLQSILSYVVPPVVAVFLLGIFWSRINRHGAFYTLVIGVPLGIVGFVVNEVFRLSSIQFLYASGISFAASCLVLVTLSLATEPPPEDKTEGLTWKRALWTAESRALADRPFYLNYRYHALALILATAGMVIWWR
ncbi:MAG: sodium:solute symporter [Rubrobacteraceae bacterium]